MTGAIGLVMCGCMWLVGGRRYCNSAHWEECKANEEPYAGAHHIGDDLVKVRTSIQMIYTTQCLVVLTHDYHYTALLMTLASVGFRQPGNLE
jgi:hypothetical protein